MDDLDYLIPEQIAQLIEDTTLNLELILFGFQCQKRYPKIKVHYNNDILFDGEIKERKILKFNKNVTNLKNLEIRLEFYNKLDNDTFVDESGKILENQGVKIEKIIVNNYDIIDCNIIYNLGKYELNLSDSKKQHFIKNNISIGDSHSLDMFENGSWNLKFNFPIASYFCSLKGSHLKHELWPNYKLLNEINDSIKNIRRLETENDKLTR
jgi:hypothetical protein